MSGKDGSSAMKERAEVPFISHTGSWDNSFVGLACSSMDGVKTWPKRLRFWDF